MSSPSNASSSSETKVGLLYDLEKKELLLRFERGSYARAYQAKNPEGRILADKPDRVWLPVPESMKYLYSSEKWGLTIFFRSDNERKEWCKRSVLGQEIETTEAGVGVRFKRYWNRDDFHKRLNYGGDGSDARKDQVDLPVRRGPQPPPSPRRERIESPASRRPGQ